MRRLRVDADRHSDFATLFHKQHAHAVRQRVGHDAGSHQDQWNEKAPDAPVPVTERVNGFELVMNESELHEQGQRVPSDRSIDVGLQSGEGVLDLGRGGRDESGIADGGAWRTDPVLRRAELTGPF